MHELATSMVRDIALAVPATTRVFEEFKIDYCCGGRQLLDEACRAAGVDTGAVLNSLTKVMTKSEAADVAPEAMGPAALIDHILAKHHAFTARELARLEPLMEKVVTRHAEHHPELAGLQALFTTLVESLVPHMRKEENVLFPHIQALERSKDLREPAPVPHFGTVRNPIRMMMAEHDADGDRLRQIREITNDYTVPDGACPSFTALYAGLEDLEKDLHRHIHLENNVLFPAATNLELSYSAQLPSR